MLESKFAEAESETHSDTARYPTDPAAAFFPPLEPAQDPKLAAFLTAYEDKYPLFVGFARKRLPNWESAEDAVQDATYKALTHIASLRDTKYVETWFVSIIINVCKDYYRISKKRTERILDLDSLAEQQTPFLDPNNPETHTFFHAMRGDVATAISRLPDSYRETAMLRTTKGMSYHDIASAQNVPIGTVKSRLHIAHDRMQPELGAYFSYFA